MPLTFPAHQGLVVPLKLWRPRWFDGTALVVGSAAPDLFNAIPTVNSHRWEGLLLAVPFTVVYAFLLRRYSADGLFGSLPDLGPLRLRSYRVLQRRRPALPITIVSATIGCLSHVFIDSFTHTQRIGANVFGLNSIAFEGPTGPIAQAKVLQYLGHTVGSLIGVILFVVVVSRRHLGAWHGPEVLEAARNAPVRAGSTYRLIAIVGASVVMAWVWSIALDTHLIFSLGLWVVLALIVAGAANKAPVPKPRHSQPRAHDTSRHL